MSESKLAQGILQFNACWKKIPFIPPNHITHSHHYLYNVSIESCSTALNIGAIGNQQVYIGKVPSWLNKSSLITSFYLPLVTVWKKEKANTLLPRQVSSNSNQLATVQNTIAKLGNSQLSTSLLKQDVSSYFGWFNVNMISNNFLLFSTFQKIL